MDNPDKQSLPRALAKIQWDEHGEAHCARWRSEAGVAPPSRIRVADDTLTADAAYRLACEGTTLLWRGDFQNARQLLQAMARRIDKRNAGNRPSAGGMTEIFHKKRMAQAQRARTLGMLLIPFEPGHRIPLRRAPDVQAACAEAYGQADEPYVASLRELLGLIGAHEWRKKGVVVPEVGGRIHPHYGVFSPVRGEYVALVANAPLPRALDGNSLAFDIGTGSGVLAAVLAQRGVERIVATDQDERALACALENAERLGFARQVEVVKADLFPAGTAPLIVCNPPWVPAKPSSALEYAVYDPDSRMLKGFLAGLLAHLAPDGEGWLIMSNLAENLGLRREGELLAMIDSAGLRVAGQENAKPMHAKASDPDDPLHLARAAEVTSLWRLVVK